MLPSCLLRWTLKFAVTAALIYLFSCPTAVSQSPANGPLSSPSPKILAEPSEIARNIGNLPLAFELNQGQSDPQARFLLHGAGYTAAFRQDEVDLLMVNPSLSFGGEGSMLSRSSGSSATLLRMRFPGSRPNAPISGDAQLPGRVNYFSGNKSAAWHTNVPTFGRIRYAGVYPGTDLLYYGTRGRLEFDFELAPGADAGAIRIQFGGSRRIRLDKVGNLIIDTGHGEIQFRKPVLYQISHGSRQPIRGEFLLAGRKTVRFSVHGWDHSLPLVIDPIFDYSTCIGMAAGAGIQVNAAGEAYVIGNSLGNDPAFPTTSGSFQSTTNNPYTIVIAKFNSTATSLIYATYISGSVSDTATAIALDTAGDVYITGTTSSPDFPVTQGAVQATNKATPNSTAFATELNPSGSALIYSTFLGGSTFSEGNAITVDGAGNTYIAGRTLDADFPTTSGAFQPSALSKPANSVDDNSGFVAKLNPGATVLVYSTYLAGHGGTDDAEAIAVDGSQEAYVAGTTVSSDFPSTSGAFQPSLKGVQDAFVTKFNASGSSLVYSTFIAGNDPTGYAEARAIAIDSSGNAYITGDTDATDYPTTQGVFQPTVAGGSMYFFVTKINNSGSALTYSTFLAGSKNVMYGAAEGDSDAIALDAQGNVYVAGITGAIDFPVTPGAYETQNLAAISTDDWAGFLTKFNPNLSTLLYSTYLSGSYSQGIYGIALDSQNNVYAAGAQDGTDFPVTPGVLGTAGAIFVTKFNAAEMKSLPVPSFTLTASQNPQECGIPVTYTASVQSASGTVPTGTTAFSVEQREPAGLGMGPWNDVTVDGSGTATFTFTSAICDLEGIFVAAYYLGDANNAPASATFKQMLTAIPTVTSLTSSATSAQYGSPLSFSVTVLDNTGKAAPGWVTFMVGNVLASSANLDSSGQATWNVPPDSQANPYPLPVGADAVTASYPGVTVSWGNQYTESSASANVNIAALGVTPAPSFSLAAGTYSAAQQVSLSDSMGSAVIYYTTDGSTPTVQNGSVYAGQISVGATETIQAMAIAPGYSQSAVSSATYTIPPNFTLTLPASISFSSSQPATATVSVTSEFGFNSAVALNCSGMPAGTSCSFSPATVTGNPQQAVTSTMTLSASTTADAASATPKAWRFYALVLLVGTFGSRWRRKRIGLISAIGMIFLLGTVNACGGGSSTVGGSGGGGGGQKPTTVTVTVTGTAGAVQNAAMVTVTYTP